MPSRAVVRTGLVSTAALSLALLAGSPALAGTTDPSVGDYCGPDTVLAGVDLSAFGLHCGDDGQVASGAGTTTPAPTDTPTPTDSPAPTDPPVVTPTPPVDVPPVTGGGTTVPVGTDGGTGTAGSGTGTGTGTAGGAGAGSGGTTSDPAKPGQTTGGTTNGTTTAPGTSLHAAATTLDPATTTKSMLTAATVSNLADSDLPSLAAMRSLPVVPVLSGGQPLSAYTPSPLVANLPATTALSAVQAPLLAVGDDAASGSGFTLAGLSSRALPGLLVVLATALVAAVGAGNLRYWQDRFGARR